MTQHDTAAIRRLANRLDSIAQNLSRTERSTSGTVDGIDREMLGDTIKAIDSASDRLSDELQSICKGLTRNAEMLYKYARELDIADAKARSLISCQ